MEAIFMNPAWAAAIGALLASALTALVTNRKNAADIALEMVREERIKREKLEERLDKLEARLDAEQAAHEETSRGKRKVTEKYHVLITAYLSLRAQALVFFAHLDANGVAHGDLPDVPAILKDDLGEAAKQNT